MKGFSHRRELDLLMVFPKEFLVICSHMLQLEETQRELSSSFYNISSALSLCIEYLLYFVALCCLGAHCGV